MISILSSRIETPTGANKLEMYTDGNDDYTYTLQLHFMPSLIDYGQLIKIRKNGTLIGKEKRIIFGNPNPREIETTDVENFNGILRERVGRLVRKTKCFSKKKSRLNDALNTFQFYWNFMNNFQRRGSPAMLEGLENHLWSWHEFLHKQLTILN
ncbi:hypothetical protein HYX58_00060 [Candidatus Dependentiae bacterium]|nr:hypothetical protein [Candidatus Dependentiae bacterium]